MSDIIVDGMTRVWWVPTAADLSAITLTEVAAGAALHELLIPAGLEGFEPSTAEIDNTSLASTFDTRLPGRGSFSGTGLVFKKQDGAAAYDDMTTFGTEGIVVIADGVAQDTPATAADKYEAFPVTTGLAYTMGRGEANSLLKLRIPTPVSAPRVQGAFVAP